MRERQGEREKGREGDNSYKIKTRIPEDKKNQNETGIYNITFYRGPYRDSWADNNNTNKEADKY
jgi:hypothetical protein